MTAIKIVWPSGFQFYSYFNNASPIVSKKKVTLIIDFDLEFLLQHKQLTKKQPDEIWLWTHIEPRMVINIAMCNTIRDIASIDYILTFDPELLKNRKSHFLQPYYKNIWVSPNINDENTKIYKASMYCGGVCWMIGHSPQIPMGTSRKNKNSVRFLLRKS